MKPIYLLSIGLLCCCGCKKKNTQPEEYFSFDADGVHYEYRQIKEQHLFGGVQTLSAGPTSATVGYQIYAYSRKDLAAPGAFTFSFASNEMPIKDTIIFNDQEAFASIEDFKIQGNSYYTDNINMGRIIFTTKNSGCLEGTFEFVAKQQYDGTMIHITNGKFSIIP